MIAAATCADENNLLHEPRPSVKSRAARVDDAGVNDDVAVSLDFDHDLPLGDVTFLGQPPRDGFAFAFECHPAADGIDGLPRWDAAGLWDAFTASAFQPAPADPDAAG